MKDLNSSFVPNYVTERTFVLCITKAKVNLINAMFVAQRLEGDLLTNMSDPVTLKTWIIA
jgi:hypothetical protein